MVKLNEVNKYEKDFYEACDLPGANVYVGPEHVLIDNVFLIHVAARQLSCFLGSKLNKTVLNRDATDVYRYIIDIDQCIVVHNNEIVIKW